MADLEAELEGWLRETPSFFHPRNDAESTSDEGFYNVKWIFHRQQRTIRSAYYFTNMLIYRGHLLMEFLHQAPSTPLSKPPSPQISKCIESALEMAKMGGEMADDSYYNAVYWVRPWNCLYPQHLTLCADDIVLYLLCHFYSTRIYDTVSRVRRPKPHRVGGRKGHEGPPQTQPYRQCHYTKAS